MDKQQVKKKLIEAIKQDSHLKDIKSVAVFGSYVNGTPSETSDVDVLINFEPLIYILAKSDRPIIPPFARN